MQIKTTSFKNAGVHVVKGRGNMTGRGSEDLLAYLFDCLDRSKNVHLIDFAQIVKIDGLGIDIICYFVKRGMHISLFNVNSEIRSMLKLAGKNNVINMIKETKIDKAISVLEKRIIEKKISIEDCEHRRLYTRINTSFSSKFKSYNEGKDTINISANVLNLSETGMQVDKIKISSAKARAYYNKLCVKGLDLHDISFKLNGDSETVECSGQYVWESNGFDNFSAGIHFKEMSNKHRNRIKKYVENH